MITVPWGRRWFFARHHDLARGVFQIGVKAIFSRYNRWARKRGYRDIQCGSVSVVQRFGSTLNLNVHLHALMMDGVYATHPQQGKGLYFVRVPAPSTEEVGLLVEKIARKSERWLAKQGYETNEDWDVDACDALLRFSPYEIFFLKNILPKMIGMDTFKKRKNSLQICYPHFEEEYNRSWLCQKHKYKTPKQVRETYLQHQKVA